jgi:hypothetical protein
MAKMQVVPKAEWKAPQVAVQPESEVSHDH